jgi:hypothetical protein
VSETTKAKVQEILRSYNSILLTALGFFLVTTYNTSEKKFDKLDDVIIKQAVVEVVQAMQATRTNAVEFDIRDIRTKIEELRLRQNDKP